MPKYFHITYTGIYEGTFDDFIDKTDKVDDAMEEQFGDEWVGSADGDYDIEREFAHIIRCKDCRFWDMIPASTATPDYHLCRRPFQSIAMTEYDFCSKAERKEK